MNPSNIGTVNAVMPWEGLQIMPLRMRPLRKGPMRSTRTPHLLSDRPGPMRPGTELSHGTQIVLLARCEPIKANAEEIAI